MAQTQDTIPAPEVKIPRGYGYGYSLYVHSVCWLLRKSVQQFSGHGATIDRFLAVDTPTLGEGEVTVPVCLPKDYAESAVAAGRKHWPLLLVAEGGGFVLGQPSDGEHIIRQLSDDLQLIVVSVEYAKSPRYPYPHALLQMFEVLRWTMSPRFREDLGHDAKIDPRNVAFMGNSAGGNLCASLSLLISFSSGPCAKFRMMLPEDFRIAGQILLYPSTACNKPYIDRYNMSPQDVREASLPVWVATMMEAAYLPPGIDTSQVFIAPLDAEPGLLGSLLKLPPVLCLMAGKDCLKYEAKAYVEKLQEAGVECTTREYAEAVDGFSHHKKDYQAERRDCWEKVCNFLREKNS